MAAARVFKAEFRVSIAQRRLDGESVSALSSKYKIKRSILYRWRDFYATREPLVSAGHGVVRLARVAKPWL
jgi:transposase-like protein